jgi:hypothetical protein
VGLGQLDSGGASFDFTVVPAGFQTKVDEWLSLAADKIELAIDLNDVLCGNTASMEALANVFFWQQMATELGIDSVANGLDYASVVADICAKPELVSQTITNPIQVGSVGQLDFTVAVRFRNGTLTPWPHWIAFVTSGSNATLSNGSGATDLNGVYTTGVTPVAAGPIELELVACVALGASTQKSPCEVFAITTSASDAGSGGPAPTSGSGTVPDISGTYTVSASCNSEFYGTGTGTVVQDGATITLTWSVTLTPNPDTASADRRCWPTFQQGALPNSGVLTGTIILGTGRADLAITEITASPCGPSKDPVESIPMGAGVIRIPINYCSGSSAAQYVARWAGP